MAVTANSGAAIGGSFNRETWSSTRLAKVASSAASIRLEVIALLPHPDKAAAIATTAPAAIFLDVRLTSRVYEDHATSASRLPSSRFSRATIASLERQAMRPGRTGLERGVEIEIKTRIENEPVPEDARHVHLSVAVTMHLAEVVLVEEIVRHDEPSLVARQRQVVGPRVWSEVERREQAWVSRVRRIEHGHEPCDVHRDEEPGAVLRHSHQLRPAARRDGREIEHRRCDAVA